MPCWSIKWTDRNGQPHERIITAPSGEEAKRELYRQLGVKRLVGYNVQRFVKP